MKKILMSLFVLGLFAFSFQAHASVLSDALLKIENLTKELTQLKLQLKASVGDYDLSPKITVIATPSTIPDGGIATISWTSEYTNECDFDGHGAGTEGSFQTPRLGVDTSYTITCTSSRMGGTASGSAVVYVEKDPVPTVAPVEPSCPSNYPNPWALCKDGKIEPATKDSKGCTTSYKCVNPNPVLPIKPSVTVLSPNGGESYKSGDKITVKWKSENYSSSNLVMISLYSSLNEGSEIMTTKNDGEETIVIPSTFGGPDDKKVVSGNYYKIAVSFGGSTTLRDYSDKTFTINSSTEIVPVLKYTSTGDTTPRIMFWPGAVNQHVDLKGNWQTDPDGKSGGWSSKQYSNDFGGREVEYCNKFYSGITSVEKYKEETISTWYNAGNIKTSKGTKMSYKCVSEKTATPSITILSPNGGETYTDGQKITVKWNTENISANHQVNLVLVGYRSNGTMGMYTLLSQEKILNDGSEVVTLPKIPTYAAINFGKNFKVEITDNGEGNSDISNSLFTINSATTKTPSIAVFSPDEGTTLKKGDYLDHRISVYNTLSKGEIFLYITEKNDSSWSSGKNKYIFAGGGYDPKVSTGSGIGIEEYGKVQIDNTFEEGSYYLLAIWKGEDGKTVQNFSDNYFKITNSTTTKNDPVISGISGPQTLDVNQTGTWKLSASSPNKGNLSYSVNWGDNPQISYSTSSAQSSIKTGQSTTFTHSYEKAGIYAPTFKVTSENTIRCITTPCPSNGGSATTSISVNVGNTTTPSITVLSPNGGESYKAGDKIKIKWTNEGASSAQNNNVFIDLYYSEVSDVGIRLDDGNGKRLFSTNTGEATIVLPTSEDLNKNLNWNTGKNFKIKVSTSEIYKYTEDYSNNYFTINSEKTATPNLKVFSASTNPDSNSIEVSNNSRTEDVLMLAFDLKALNSDIKIDKINLRITGSMVKGDLEDMVNRIKVKANSVVSDFDLGANFISGNIYTIDLEDSVTIKEDSKESFRVFANINSIDNFTSGDSMTLSLVDISAEDKNGDNIVISQPISGITGGTQYFVEEDNYDDSKITVLSPKGGEIWSYGNSYDVIWKTSYDQKVNIALQVDHDDGNGAYYCQLGSTEGSVGRYKIKLTENMPCVSQVNKIITPGKYKIYVYMPAMGMATFAGVSDNYFTITSLPTPSIIPTIKTFENVTSPTTPITTTRTLKVGVKGDDVKALQTLLGLTADGSFGPMTKAKVIEWQKANNLKADGAFGNVSRLKAGL